MGKEKKQYPKITKKSLDYLDEVEKNREVTFQSLDVFGIVYSESSVKGRIKYDLERIPSLKKRYKYLSEAKIFINQMNPNTHLKEELPTTEAIRLGMVHAHFSLIGWISEELNKVESEKKKAKEKEEVKKQIIDAQRSFKIDKDYAHLLLNMWELMKDRKNYLIHPDTAFEDFKIIFEHKKKEEIKNPIAWVGNKITLVKLFYTLSEKNIIEGVKLYGDKINPLNLTFIDHNTKKPFPLWRNTYSTMRRDTIIREQYKIDKILALFA